MKELLKSILTEESLRGFERYLIVYKGLSKNTVGNYVNVSRLILRRLSSYKPTKEEIEIFIEEVRTSEREYSWSHICNLSISIERYMEFIGTPIKLGRPKKPKKVLCETLTEAEIVILINSAKNIREKAFLALLSYSALRNAEFCNLLVKHIDFSNNEIIVINGKGAKDRIVYMSSDCMKILIEYIYSFGLSPEDNLFYTTRGRNKIRPHVVRRTLQRIVKRTKINKKVYPHLLRHSWATNVLNKGANIRTIQAQLGHSNIETTMIYANSRPQRVKAECQIFSPSYM